MLQPEDLTLMYGMEPGGGITAPKSVEDKASIARLTEVGFLADGVMTEAGKEFHAKVVKRLDELKAGIPIDGRSKPQPGKATQPKSTVLGWLTGTHAKKDYVTNGAVFILGKPGKEMEAKEGPSDFRQKVSALLNTHTAGKLEDYVEVVAYSYQLAELGGMELIWLAEKEFTAEPLAPIPVQAMYIDLIRDRYPSATFWVNSKRFASGKISDQILVARVTNRGIKNNVVALVIAVQGPPQAPVDGRWM